MKYIIANWKMNTTLTEASILANGVKEGIADFTTNTVVLCPPSIWLTTLAETFAKHPLKQLKLGAQNIHFADKGAYTGEIAAPMLKGIAEYAILGHSERRKYFHETDEMVQLKVKQALTNGLTPVLCVGESRQPAEEALHNPAKLSKAHIQPILHQLDIALKDLSENELKQVVIAYEPVWAITGSGKGVAATGLYANHVAEMINKHLLFRFGKVGESMPILYGGSANAENAGEFLHQPALSGLLVGSAGLKLDQFISICRQAA